MAPTTRNGGPRARTAAAHITAPTKVQHPDGSAIPRIGARFYGPSGRRGLGVLVVSSCPYCSRAHIHRGAGGPRRAGCGVGRYFLVAVPGVTRGRAS